jgi:hypothetical protein
MTLGFNYYITSERFLDHRVALHPPATHGGNGRHSYADTEAVRVPMPPGSTGLAAAAARRLGALPRRPARGDGGAHRLHGDEQVRWLVECWRAVKTLRAEGADLRAVTVWALFGAVDWCSLLTRRTGRYEPGAFDVGVPAAARSRGPRCSRRRRRPSPATGLSTIRCCGSRAGGSGKSACTPRCGARAEGGGPRRAGRPAAARGPLTP